MADPNTNRDNPVDRHVGPQIRLRRTELSMLQERPGTALGLSIQQTQKYENGENRLGASRLFDLSRVLNVPGTYFYGRMPGAGAVPPGIGDLGRSQAASADDPLSRPKTLELISVFHRVADPATRAKLLGLIISMGPPDE